MASISVTSPIFTKETLTGGPCNMVIGPTRSTSGLSSSISHFCPIGRWTRPSCLPTATRALSTAREEAADSSLVLRAYTKSTSVAYALGTTVSLIHPLHCETSQASQLQQPWVALTSMTGLSMTDFGWIRGMGLTMVAAKMPTVGSARIAPAPALSVIN